MPSTHAYFICFFPAGLRSFWVQVTQYASQVSGPAQLGCGVWHQQLVDPPPPKFGETRRKCHPCPSMCSSVRTLCVLLCGSCSLQHQVHTALHFQVFSNSPPHHLLNPDTGHLAILPNGRPTHLCLHSVLPVGTPFPLQSLPCNPLRNRLFISLAPVIRQGFSYLPFLLLDSTFS